MRAGLSSRQASSCWVHNACAPCTPPWVWDARSARAMYVGTCTLAHARTRVGRSRRRYVKLLGDAGIVCLCWNLVSMSAWSPCFRLGPTAVTPLVPLVSISACKASRFFTEASTTGRLAARLSAHCMYRTPLLSVPPVGLQGGCRG